MFEIIFLCFLALIWIIFATVQDLKTREVSNWLNFSLIIFALGFRFFYSLFSSEWNFLFQGLIGLGIFFVIGNIFYYSRVFAGGDAKLLIALGAILPLSSSFFTNLKILFIFLLFFLVAGAFYGLVYSFVLVGKHFVNFKRSFRERLVKNRKFMLLFLFLAIIFGVFGFINSLFFYIGFLLFISPYLFVYAKSLEKSCLTKKISPRQLREGDWLVKDIRVGNKVIRASWDGLSLENISLLKRKSKLVEIKEGIPFVPVFLISFIIFTLLFFSGILDKIFLLF